MTATTWPTAKTKANRTSGLRTEKWGATREAMGLGPLRDSRHVFLEDQRVQITVLRIVAGATGDALP